MVDLNELDESWQSEPTKNDDLVETEAVVVEFPEAIEEAQGEG